MTNAFALGLMGAALTDIGDRARAAPAFTKARNIALQTAAGEVRGRQLLRLDAARRRGSDRNVGQGGAGGPDPGARRRASTASIRASTTRRRRKRRGCSSPRTKSKRRRRPSTSRSRARTSPARRRAARSCASARRSTAGRQGVAVKNNGQKDVWRIVSAEGIPAQALPAAQNGVSLSKAILTMDGPTGEPHQREAERPLHRPSVG